MSLLSKLQNVVKRAVVRRTGKHVQVEHLGGALLSDVEYMQPQGLAFTPADSAQGVLVSPTGVTSAGVALNLSGDTPDLAEAGTGGLHFLGTFKLYLDQDGTIHLGSKNPSDFLALASKVNAGFTTRGNDITTLKNATATLAGILDGIAPGTSSAFSLATGAIPGSVPSVASAKVRSE